MVQQHTYPPTCLSLLPTVGRGAFDCCGLQLFAVAFSCGTEFMNQFRVSAIQPAASQRKKCTAALPYKIEWTYVQKHDQEKILLFL